MGRKRICRDGDDAASPPPPKRGKVSVAEPSRNRRKVPAARGKAPVRKYAPDLDLPNEDVELVPVTDRLYTHEGTRSCNMFFHPPKPKDYMRNHGQVFDQRFINPDEVDVVEKLDPRFVTPFQLDYYNSAILPKLQPVVKQKYIDWDHCLKLDDPVMTKSLAILERHNFKNIMTMQYPWNNEVIAQFFATVWYEDPTVTRHGIVHFSTQDQRYLVSYPRFAQILGFDDDDFDKPWLDCTPHLKNDISFAYYEGATMKEFYTTKKMKKLYRYINLLVRKTLIPKIGGASEILSSVGPFLAALSEDKDGSFSAFGFILNQIQLTSWDSKRSCSHAPYIMKMIEIVTKKQFIKEICHESYKPVRIDTSAPRRGRKPRQPPPQSEPLLSPEATTSAGVAACPPQANPGLVMRALRSVFGMCMDINEANKEHQRLVQEELHRAEVQHKVIAEEAGVPLSPVRLLPPAPPQPAWFHPQFQQSSAQPQSFAQSEQPKSSSHAQQGVGASPSSGWVRLHMN